MLKDTLALKHNVEIELFGPDGKLKERRVLHNLIPDAGKAAAAEQLLAEPGKAKPTHIAIGTGTTEAKAADTTLKTELDRNALVSKTRSGNVVTCIAEWAPGDGTGEITEAGILNAPAAGDLYARGVFGVITKAAGDELKITWKITVG